MDIAQLIGPLAEPGDTVDSEIMKVLFLNFRFSQNHIAISQETMCQAITVQII